MRKRAIRLMVYVAIVLGSILITFFVQMSAFGGWIEQRTYDLRFKLRGQLPALPDVPITILAVDEKTLAKISEPLLLWHSHFAKVIDALTQVGTGVIAADFILADITRFDPAGQQSLSQALLQAAARSVPVVLAYRVRQGGLEQAPEAVRLAALAVDHPLAFINLTTDSDDFVRRQEIEAWSSEGHKQPSFALAIADAFSTKYKRPRKPVPTGSTLFINYRGPEHYERISFGEALKAAETDDQEYLKRHFAGRIVLIGYVGERGDDDFHSTPQYYWSGRSSSGALRTPGIEIHGHAVSTLLSGQFIQPLSPMLQRLVTLALIGIIAALCFGRQPMTGVAVSIAVVVVFITASILAFNAGYAVMMLPPIFGSALMLGLSQSTNFLLEGREKRRLRQLFKRYLNDKVIEQIVATPDKLAFKA
jgi:adenylate cyclase